MRALVTTHAHASCRSRDGNAPSTQESVRRLSGSQVLYLSPSNHAMYCMLTKKDTCTPTNGMFHPTSCYFTPHAPGTHMTHGWMPFVGKRRLPETTRPLVPLLFVARNSRLVILSSSAADKKILLCLDLLARPMPCHAMPYRPTCPSPPAAAVPCRVAPNGAAAWWTSLTRRTSTRTVRAGAAAPGAAQGARGPR